VVEHAQRAKEADVLEGAGDPGGDDAVRAEAGERAAGEGDRTGSRGIEAGDEVECSRLARAVRADQADQLALP
jgi:hypothetical protein